MPAAKSSSALWWIVGLLSALCVVGLILVAALLARTLRAPEEASVAAAPSALSVPVELPSSASAAPVASGPPKPAALTDGEKDELEGSYTCAMDDTPAFRCRISNSTLEKLEGSQRFKGPVSKVGGGNIAFSGTFFCPQGACTHPVATTFIRQSPGRYVGKFGPNSIPGGGPGGERVVLIKVR